MPLPGLKIGPLDPDSTQEFGQVNAANSARALVRLHSQAHPPVLVQTLARPLDPERTKGLVLDEVRGYLAGLKLENGDPVVPKGSTVVGAQVRGQRDAEQVLTFTYRTESGRTGKWFAEIDPSKLTESMEAGDELVRIQEMKDKGLVSWDSQGTSNEILRRENAGLRRQNEALRGQFESGSSKKAKAPAKVEGDTRPDDQIVAENEQLRREAQELRDRNAQLEAAQDRVGQESLRPPAAQAAAENEPFEGYDDLKATDVIKRLKADDTTNEEREAILAYERSHADRRSVVSAGEQARGSGS